MNAVASILKRRSIEPHTCSRWKLPGKTVIAWWDEWVVEKEVIGRAETRINHIFSGNFALEICGPIPRDVCGA
jgi:hypothetical protein